MPKCAFWRLELSMNRIFPHQRVAEETETFKLDAIRETQATTIRRMQWMSRKNTVQKLKLE
jgi:hypothetical protein